MTAVYEIVTDFFLLLFVENFNQFPHCLDRVNVGKYAIISFDDELQYYGAREGLTWHGMCNS